MKRTILLTAGLVAALVIGVSLAQERPQGPRPGGPPPGHLQHPPILAALDIDRDGTLSADEISNASTALLDLDVDGDGALSPQELRPPPPPGDNRPGRRPPQPPPGGNPIMGLDTNGDGLISFEEFAAPAREHFATIDADGNGQIDATEAEAAQPPPPPRHRGPGVRPPKGGE